MKLLRHAIIPISLLLFFSACSSDPPVANEVASSPLATLPALRWEDLLESVPSAHTTPLPPAEHTEIDGVYALLDESWPQWWKCLRCADYRPAGGVWRLQFDRGVMRIFYNVTGWHAVASYTVEGDTLKIFNDGYCPQETGEYTWALEDTWGLEDRVLSLDVVQDACSINLRGENLSRESWYNCLPPNVMTGASGHYHREPACDESPELEEFILPDGGQVEINIYGDDAREYAQPPDLIIFANPENVALPEGILVTPSEESIPYGLSRVLWGIGDWIEISFTAEKDSTVGVQFLGDYTIGWAAVWLDGAEVWRGNTYDIWNELGRHGGYIEISGVTPGEHTLRVESIGTDHRPVTVAFFGLHNTDGVSP